MNILAGNIHIHKKILFKKCKGNVLAATRNCDNSKIHNNKRKSRLRTVSSRPFELLHILKLFYNQECSALKL